MDFDGDGRRDLVKSTPDALASAANYLDSRSAGSANQPWLEEVRVPAELPWDQADVTIKKPRAFWAQQGVTYSNGKPIPADNVPVGLRAADGPERAGVPRLSEFRRLSRLEPVAGLFHHAPPITPRGSPARLRSPAAMRRSRALSLAETKELQQLLAKRGFDVGKIDGVVGAASRDAIRTMQIKYGLPADGYPSAELLSRLRAG